MTEKVQFNIYLPGPLVKRVKHAAIEEGLSLSAFVENVLTRALDNEKGESE